MLRLTIEVFALYSVDRFGEENKGHHQKHNLHLIKRHMILSLIILWKIYQGNIRMRLYFKSIPPANRTSSKDRSLSFPLELMYFILLDFQGNLLHFTRIDLWYKVSCVERLLCCVIQKTSQTISKRVIDVHENLIFS